MMEKSFYRWSLMCLLGLILLLDQTAWVVNAHGHNGDGHDDSDDSETTCDGSDSDDAVSRRLKREAVVPTLYPYDEPILQFVPGNFSEVVYKPDSAKLVQFYASWCGHCRHFVKEFTLFARRVRKWSDVVQIAIVNCALPAHSELCTEHGVKKYPTMKYFHREATTAEDGRRVNLSSVDRMQTVRQLLARNLKNEYAEKQYKDWPNLMDQKISGKEDLSNIFPGKAQYRAVISCPTNCTAGVEISLDMWSDRSRIETVMEAGDFAQKFMGVTNLPMVHVYDSKLQETNDPEYCSDYVTLMRQEIQERFNPSSPTTTPASWSTNNPISTTPVPRLDYLSEKDLLIAAWYALFVDVPAGRLVIQGENFKTLHNFVHILSKYWPITKEAYGNLESLQIPVSKNLTRSARARQIFCDLCDALNQTSGQTIKVSEWKQLFIKLEEKQGLPFKFDSNNWETCRGSQNGKRGYTCGLWSIFHALTVSYYLTEENTPKIGTSYMPIGQPTNGSSVSDDSESGSVLSVPKGIQSWINSSSDVVMYFWAAHNRVNIRLAGDDSDDPQFPKQLWPSQTQCPTCGTPNEMDKDNYPEGSCDWPEGDEWNREEVKKFLIRYYSQIKPSGL